MMRFLVRLAKSYGCIGLPLLLITILTTVQVVTYKEEQIDHQWGVPNIPRRVTRRPRTNTTGAVKNQTMHAVSTTTKPRYDAPSVDERQRARFRLIDEVCRSEPQIARMESRTWSYKLSKTNKYLLCPVPKSGWSSWKRLWFFTSGVISSYETDPGVRNDREAGIVDVKGSRGAQIAWKAGLYNYSFVFVRNPWDRLVSAYLNKAVDYNYSRILHTPCSWESMVPYKPDLTFEQFLNCIAKGSNDMHWVPQTKLCDVCNTKFDFIGHLETVEEDAAYVIKKIGLKAEYPHSFASKKHKTKHTLADWYEDLPVNLLKTLKTRYQFDFLLHGYDPHPPGRPDVD